MAVRFSASVQDNSRRLPPLVGRLPSSLDANASSPSSRSGVGFSRQTSYEGTVGSEKGITERVDDQVALIQTTQRSNEATYGHLEGEAVRLVHCVKAEACVRTFASDSLAVQLKELQARCEQELRHERWARGNMDVRLNREIEQTTAEAQSLATEACEVKDESSRQTGGIAHEICRLYSDIDMAGQYRIQRKDHLIEGVRHKLQEVRRAAVAEKELREESEGVLLELFSHMADKLNLMMVSARKERLGATERLVQVMEQVVPALDQASHRLDLMDFERPDGGSSGQALAEVGLENMKRRHSISHSTAGVHNQLCFSTTVA